jgi:hypothetical protein
VFKDRLAERESSRLFSLESPDAQRARHELELLAAKVSARERAARGLLVGSVSLAVLALAAAIVLELFVHRPELVRLSQRSRDALAAESARIAEVRNLLADSERRRQALLDELERRKREQSVTPTLPHTRPSPARPAPRGPVTPGSKPCVGDPNDPLNPCLGS